MTYFQPISVASDRVVANLIAGLEIDYGYDAAEALAHRFLEAEDTDFRWDARVEERWLGTYYGHDEEDLELDRVAIIGKLDGKWFVSTMIVDGDGNAHGMLGCRSFRSERLAREAFAHG